jgi:hypothetical protein
MFLRNVSCNSTDCTASHPRRWYSSKQFPVYMETGLSLPSSQMLASGRCRQLYCIRGYKKQIQHCWILGYRGGKDKTVTDNSISVRAHVRVCGLTTEFVRGKVWGSRVKLPTFGMQGEFMEITLLLYYNSVLSKVSVSVTTIVPCPK